MEEGEYFEKRLAKRVIEVLEKEFNRAKLNREGKGIYVGKYCEKRD
ncbi:hypothetical protein [Caldanaerobacter subterraneus]|uniref:Uncharacterized protein n=1 Tax=Caldanaerobacter subterraneus TaxID=911092 RepID=A0A7Y2LA00_9THEO|nr:hypothetical protein [Caldanaerobacter subterraneus]NNG67957.1 hypothetical protein [Caldanaerobacter subterraneus]